MENKRDRIIFICYICAFLAVATVIALMQPLADTPPLFGNPPDEHARFLVPKYIYEHGVIPTGAEEEIRIPSYGFSYGIYNVFPYIVQGYVMRFVGLFTDSMQVLLYAARFVNVISGCMMAVVVYLLSEKLFDSRAFRWIFCFGIMFLPQNLFMHTYVNTDSMCLLSTAMIVYAWVGANEEGYSRANILWLSGGIILCALSYYNAYGYILCSILLFVAHYLRKTEGKWTLKWNEMLVKGGIVAGLVILGIGWWFIRSYMINDGDLLGLATREKMAIKYAIAEVNPLTMPTYQNRGYTVLEMMREGNFVKGAFTSFVAAFGSMTVFASWWIYGAYMAFFAVGLISYVALRDKNIGDCGFHGVFFNVNMVMCIIIPVVLLVYYAYTTDYQYQGRYLLPGLIPLFYYVTTGLRKLLNRKWMPRWLSNVGMFSAIVLPVVSTLYMLVKSIGVYLQTGMVM